jgi:antitoxin (DNA-binding transcriptional repressor) of toxin-antitoxin stability system
MRSVGLKVLKNKLSEYVRLAASGETVLVTDRDRVVAEIVPPQPHRNKLSEEEFLAKGVREGWITPPTNPSKEPPPRKPMVPFDELMAELDRDREDRDLP